MPKPARAVASLCGVAALVVGAFFSSPAIAQDGSVQPTSYTQDDVSAFNDFLVQYDQVRLMRLAEGAADVIIGNPSIADVTIQSDRLLAVTGKTFGVTNLIILNNAGEVVVNRRLIVRADDQKIVNLTRGGERQTYNCAPNCQPVIQIGDEANYFLNVARAASEKFKVSDAVAAQSQAAE